MSTDDVYFTDEHRAFREMVRRFVRAEMAPHVDAWEAANGFPRDLYRKCGALGLLGLGHAEEYGGTSERRHLPPADSGRRDGDLRIVRRPGGDA